MERKDRIEILKALTLAYGVPGHEDPVIDVVAQYRKDLRVEKDVMKNAYLTKGQPTGKPIVMLDSHLDEVGFMVSAIGEDGLLDIHPIGGWTPYTVPAHLFWVKSTTKGWIRGITGTRPPHFLTEEERKQSLSMDHIKIDIGATSKEDAMDYFGIQIGAPIAPDRIFEMIEGTTRMMGCAFDNRIGTAAVLEAMLDLPQDLPVDVVGAMASQEEMGLRGAKVTAQVVKPDFAIIFEGSPSDEYGGDPSKVQCAIGKGPQLRMIDREYITHPDFAAFAQQVAKESDIPVQIAVRKGGATNAGSIHTSGKGIPCIVIGIPSRYIHTAYQIADIRDLERAVQLAHAILARMDEDFLSRFHQVWEPQV